MTTTKTNKTQRINKTKSLLFEKFIIWKGKADKLLVKLNKYVERCELTKLERKGEITHEI